MVNAGKPNKGVDVDGCSGATGAGGREGEADVWFEDATGMEHEEFSEL